MIQDGSSAVALTKTGNRTFTLTGLNSYSGKTTVSGGGTLEFNSIDEVGGKIAPGSFDGFDLHAERIGDLGEEFDIEPAPGTGILVLDIARLLAGHHWNLEHTAGTDLVENGRRIILGRSDLWRGDDRKAERHQRCQRFQC